jgi:hypothetical protein
MAWRRVRKDPGDERQKTNLKILDKIFLSVLDLILFRDNTVKNGYEQIHQSDLPQGKKQSFLSDMINYFMSEILTAAHHDLINLSSKYLDDKAIRGFHIGKTIRIASDSGLIIDLEDRQSLFLGRPVEKLNLVTW